METAGKRVVDTLKDSDPLSSELLNRYLWMVLRKNSKGGVIHGSMDLRNPELMESSSSTELFRCELTVPACGSN